MTRKQAAEYIGVSVPTISNLMERGVLGGKKLAHGYYVCDDDVKKYAEQYRCISANEKFIEAYKWKITQERQQLMKQEDKLRQELLGKRPNAFSTMFVKDFFIVLFDLCSDKIPQKNQKVVLGYLDGKCYEQLADEYGLTRERIRQLVYSTINRLRMQTDELHQVLKNARKWESEITMLRCENKVLKEQVNKEKKQEVAKTSTPDLFLLKVDDLNVSLRLKNCLKAEDINTVGELCLNVTSFSDLTKIRNFGMKSLMELKDFMDVFGLRFKREDETLEHYYSEMNENLDK